MNKTKLLELENNLTVAIKNKDSRNLEFFLCQIDEELNEPKITKLINEASLKNWHESHEDIANLLGFIGNQESENILFLLSQQTFDYLAYDSNNSLARKCIRSLGQLDTINSWSLIKRLSNSNDQKISSFASAYYNKFHPR